MLSILVWLYRRWCDSVVCEYEQSTYRWERIVNVGIGGLVLRRRHTRIPPKKKKKKIFVCTVVWREPAKAEASSEYRIGYIDMRNQCDDMQPPRQAHFTYIVMWKCGTFVRAQTACDSRCVCRAHYVGCCLTVTSCARAYSFGFT